jgi:hypothetical protein
MHFRANMRNCGMNQAAPLQQQIAVVSCPPSVPEIIPICFYPVVERILGGLFVEVCTPMLSMF